MHKEILNQTEFEFILTKLRDLVVSGKFDEPKTILERLRPTYPENINLLNLLGIIYLNLKHYKEALDCFDSILKLNLDDPSDALNNRAVILLELNRLNEALEGFKKAVSINDKEFSYLLNLGKLLFKMHHPNEALEMLNNAIKINQTSFEAYASKGLVMEELEDFHAAIECYNNAIHYNTGYAPAFWNKGLILLKLGNYKEGWDLYEWRWKDLQRNSVRIFHEPTWTGQENLEEKKIFIL
jgi:tetratricopeptide (TPR) repeat protein